MKFIIIFFIFEFSECYEDKNLSVGARVHIFLMKMMGKHEVITKQEPKVVFETYPRHYRPTTTTTEHPFVIGIDTLTVQSDRSLRTIPVPIEEPLGSEIVKLLKQKVITKLPDGFVKIYVTTTTAKPSSDSASDKQRAAQRKTRN